MTDTAPTAAPAQPEASPLPLARPTRVRIRSSTLAWLAILALLLVMAWPGIKRAYSGRHGIAPPNDGIPWRTDFDAALAEAGRTGKPLLIDFGADWCPPCQVMRKESWPDARVRQAVADGYVPLYLDADADDTIAPAERFGVSTLPAVLVVDSHGTVLRGDSIMDANELLAFLRG